MRLTLIPLAALVPAVTTATDYLSIAQAQKLMFPDADGFVVHDLRLDDAQRQALARLAGVPLPAAQWQVQAARRNGHDIGYLLVDHVIGKFEMIDYAVAFNSDGSVHQVEILSYRESHGYEVRLPAWRRQFAGKNIRAPLHVGTDIANISGATLSCTHLTDGIRRAVALLRVARDSGLLPAP
jgi:Na+-translocating ferredoxin:NAD+ oxidoreductase RnfG subunit